MISFAAVLAVKFDVERNKWYAIAGYKDKMGKQVIKTMPVTLEWIKLNFNADMIKMIKFDGT